MDETVPRPLETNPRLTERRQSLADIMLFTQVAFLCLIDRDKQCN